MNSSGYTLELYCESGRRGVHKWQEFPHEYIDPEQGSKCRAQARKDGWSINKPNEELCPKCNPKSKHYVSTNQIEDGDSDARF